MYAVKRIRNITGTHVIASSLVTMMMAKPASAIERIPLTKVSPSVVGVFIGIPQLGHETASMLTIFVQSGHSKVAINHPLIVNEKPASLSVVGLTISRDEIKRLVVGKPRNDGHMRGDRTHRYRSAQKADATLDALAHCVRAIDEFGLV